MLVLNFIFQALKIIILLSVLVIIHEGGHFLVSKFFKIPVSEFAIGFGKKLWSKKKGETEYSIRLFPLGGFVNIDDENSDGAFGKAPLYQKNLILLAGTFVNFVFAIILAFIVLFAQGNYVTNVIDSTIENSPISQVGIQPGDEIYRINGKRIHTKSNIDTLMQGNNDLLKVEVKRDNQIYSYDVKPIVEYYAVTGFAIDENNLISKIQSGYNYNLEVGDKIVGLNDIKIETVDQFLDELYLHFDEKVNITVSRNGQEIVENIKVEKYEQKYLGVILKSADKTIINGIYYAGIGTTDFLYETFKGLADLITGNRGNAQLMGIIGVSDIIVKTSGFLDYLGIMASVSLSLAVVNLFPLPLLDGGKIVMFTIEKCRKKQFSEKFVNICTTTTIILLVMLTVYIMVSDITKLV